MKTPIQQQQEQWRKQQMAAAAAAQQQARAKQARRQEAIIQSQSGGVNVTNGAGTVSVGREVVGRDKIEEHKNFYLDEPQLEEKSDRAFVFERAFLFVFAFAISGVMCGGLGALIGSALGGGGIVVGGLVGLLPALGFAFVSANQVSRYRR